MDMTYPLSEGAYILERLAKSDFPGFARGFALLQGFNRRSTELRGIRPAGLP